MAVVTFTPLIVLSYKTLAGPTVEQTVFVPMAGRWNGDWYLPDHDFQKAAVREDAPVTDDQMRLHRAALHQM